MADLLRRAPSCRTEPPAGYIWTPPPFAVVFQFCDRDKEQAVRVLNWQTELCPKQPNELHLLTDEGVECDDLVRIAQASWQKVHLHRIQPVKGKWPQGNNHAFAETCRIMGQFVKPWLLWETDAIPAKPDWLQVLEAEYAKAKRPFMGAWVEHYDILNGGAIYPPDVLPWILNFMRRPAVDQMAYDCAVAPELIWYVHPASHLMPNIFYSRSNGRPGGIGIKPNPPEWTKRMFEWVCTHDVCLLHRDKAGACIEFLREKLFDKASGPA